MGVDYRLLGKRISKRRRELGLKQYQVCELAGFNDKYLSCIETARSVPSIDVLVRIAEVLKVTPDYLLLGTEPANELYTQLSDERFSKLNEKNKRLTISFMEWLDEQQKKEVSD